MCNFFMSRAFVKLMMLLLRRTLVLKKRKSAIGSRKLTDYQPCDLRLTTCDVQHYSERTSE